VAHSYFFCGKCLLILYGHFLVGWCCRIADNGVRLKEVGDFEAQTFF
jgi:hypothetical protein